jgi:methionyl aminopeptidase
MYAMFVGKKVNIKSAHEIELMRSAGRINGAALSAVKAMIRPGITTGELDEVAYEVIRKHGGKPAFLDYPGPYPYPATTTISINDELVHGIPGDTVLRAGDIVSVDCGTILDGYVADSAFSVGVGEISTEAQTLLDVTERSLYLGIEKMRAGNRVGDVSSVIQNHVESYGFHVTREYSGHGVGRNMHEGPWVPNYGTARRGLVFRSGMTIALEPMVLIGTDKTRVRGDQWTVASADGSLTAHFEHTVAVTKGDPEILTLMEEDQALD